MEKEFLKLAKKPGAQSHTYGQFTVVISGNQLARMRYVFDWKARKITTYVNDELLKAKTYKPWFERIRL